MKRIFIFTLASVLSLGAIYGQGQMDAYNFSRNDLRGTARSSAMGGAFGALGGDITGISINPAGIGVYKSSEIVTTLNFENTRTETNLNAGSLRENRFKFNFDNLGFVTTFPVNSDAASSVNFGFSYNRLKNFDRRYSMQSWDQQKSLPDYMAYRADAARISDPDNTIFVDPRENRTNRNIWDNQDWLAVFGYSGFLINHLGGTEYAPAIVNGNNGLSADNYLFVEESGSINTYDFNVGTTFADMLSVGLTLSVTDINYRMYSAYDEYYGGTDAHMFLDNWKRTRGSGWQVSPGIIFKPVHELRIGISYHSPTWYNMSDYFAADLSHDLTDIVDATNASIDPNYPGADVIQSYNGQGDGVTDYNFRTPDKWTFSVAGVIGRVAIISADYEIMNYGNMKLFDRNGRRLPGDPNQFIKQDFRNASTLRVGAEVRVTPQFSARVGYAWMQSPLETNFRNNNFEVFTAGSIPHYTLDGDINNFTYGLGYRFSRSFYTDIAFVMSWMKSSLHTFPSGFDAQDRLLFESEGASLRTNSFQGLMTLGYRF